jgi:hypothetical protein
MKPDFIIFSPDYNPNNGGAIVLHYLCHLLNANGFLAHILPYFHCQDVSPFDDLVEKVCELNEVKKRILGTPYQLNPDWNTPLYPKEIAHIRHRDDVVVVYPEIIFGNPLRARHVARWLLHEPGFHHRQVYFEHGEVQFRYLDLHPVVRMPWVDLSNHFLTVMHIPWQHYTPAPEGHKREGTAYMIRKGHGKQVIHDLSNSFQIDGKSHAEIGEIFRSVQTFISYDTKSIYSMLAALAGADSVVVPDDGVDEADWQPVTEMRFGIAYGFEKLEWAKSTRHLVAENLRKLDDDSMSSVRQFAHDWQLRLNQT